MARSLKLRLTSVAAVAIALALAASWAALTWIFDRHMERREASELTRVGLALVGSLAVNEDGALEVLEPPTDERFFDPTGGYYWQVGTGATALRSRSLWDQALPAPLARPDDWTTRTVPGPHGGRILMVERLVQPPGATKPLPVQVALEDAPLQEATDEFSREIGLSLLVLGLVLAAAAYAQVRLGLQPLGRVQDDLARMRRSPTARLSETHPSEIQPLASAINSLADAREADLKRARQRAADLAHSLKTPLAAMAAQSRKARAAGARDAADGLDRAVAAMGAALETELARARAAAARLDGEAVESAPAAIAEQIILVVERTERGETVAFENLLPEGLRVPVRAPDLMEILGALVENAARFARSRVRVAPSAREDWVGVVIEDDGDGIDDDRAAAALLRGARLDEVGGGHGLGLAIVRELVAATDGDLSLGKAELGGLRVELAWRAPRAA